MSAKILTNFVWYVRTVNLIPVLIITVLRISFIKNGGYLMYISFLFH